MFKENVFYSKKHEGEHLNFLSYNLDSKEKLPLIFYIHGAGSRGDDLSQFNHAAILEEIEKGREMPAVVLSPQCCAETWFDLFEVLCEFCDWARHLDNVDIDRVYVVGASMGGYCTWQLGISHPEWFAALMVCCGGGMYWDAGRLKDVPVWAFHGALDEIVLPDESVHMVKYINKAGGHAKLTIVPDVAHGVWDNAFSSDEMWKWLFEQKKEH